MKNLKNAILYTLCVLMGILSEVMAQPMNRGGFNAPGIQYFMTEYGDELELTEDQKDELFALQIENRNQLRADRRSERRSERGNVRRGRDFRNRAEGRNLREERIESQLQMRQEVLNILTNEQVELLQTKMIDRAEQAHEIRIDRHRFMVSEAGIEGDKAEQVLSLLNSQSADRLEQAKIQIQNPGEVDQDARKQHIENMRETDDALMDLLTANEYRALRSMMRFDRLGPGRGIGNRGPGMRGK